MKPYRVIDTTYDGVKVLAPKVRSKNFTVPEVRKAIREGLAARNLSSVPGKKSGVETSVR